MSFDLKLVNGDLVIGSDGDVAKVENTDKLVQDILKIILTPVNGNPFHPAYGSYLTNSLIGNNLPDSFVISTAENQIKDSLQTLMKQQKIQSTRQPVTASEALAAIQSVKVERNLVDPRFFQVLVNVLARDFTSVPTIQFSVNPL